MSFEAAELDSAAVRIARSRGAIDLALGDALARLFDRDGLIQLGYARRADFARERLGVPPRTMFGWVRLSRALADRPLLRRAVVAGAVSPRKAIAIAPLAVGVAAETWVAAARQLRTRATAPNVLDRGRRWATSRRYSILCRFFESG